MFWGEENGAAGGAWANTNWWKAGAWANNTCPSIRVNLRPDRTCYYTFGVTNALTNIVARPPETFITGEVGVQATRRETTEERPAAFVISRPATATNEKLLVPYTLSGGVGGRDFVAHESPGIIPAGDTKVSLTLAPSFYFGDTRPKLVTLTLLPGAYRMGTHSNACILTQAK